MNGHMKGHPAIAHYICILMHLWPATSYDSAVCFVILYAPCTTELKKLGNMTNPRWQAVSRCAPGVQLRQLLSSCSAAIENLCQPWQLVD